MGHNRLGRLPRTHRWREVIALLDAPSSPADAVAQAVAIAADHRLSQLAREDSLSYAFWILARITFAARSDSFLSDIAWLGIRQAPDASALGIVAGAVQHVRDELARQPTQSDFNEIAALALGKALSQTVGSQGPGLFSSTAEDTQRAFRTYSTSAQFGVLARAFFSDFIARSLRSFVDRELLNHAGPGKTNANASDSGIFLEALSLHSLQAARIVEEFSGGWYSKYNWETAGEIRLDEARRFVGQALRKLRGELKRGADVT